MFGQEKLKAEIVRLSYRVAELEERLCPCEQHDWKRIGVDYTYDGIGGYDTLYDYKCARCGKKTRSIGVCMEREERADADRITMAGSGK